ncbi:MAG TPA: tetratricopeptide repeat protein, partial [Tepidisphaeraceae bacterium]|nr:tetratricopeptide repeat protein [Tepidisphaeraceae bacterium]
LGDEKAAGGDWRAAGEAYARAVALDQKNPGPLMKLGEVHERLGGEEPEFIGKSRGAYQRALEVDPGNAEAMRRLLKSYRDEMAIGQPRPELYNTVGDLATKLAAADPNDKAYAADRFAMPVRASLAGVAIDPARLEEAERGLRTAAGEDPANAELSLLVARLELRRAEDAAKRGHAQEAQDRWAAAVQVMEDAVKAQPENPAVLLRASQVTAGVDQIDPDPARSARYAAGGDELLAQAHAAAKPGSPAYTDVQLAWSAKLQRDGDKPAAEKVLRELVAQRPGEATPRLALVELLAADPARRPEALALLAEPLTLPPDANPFTALAAKDFSAARAKLIASQLRIDMYQSATEPAEKQALLDQTSADLGVLAERYGDAPEVLKLRGKLELAKGDEVAAIQTLNKALGLQSQSSQPKDYDLMFTLARAYAQGKQTGPAKDLLRQVVDRADRFTPARALLAQLLLQDNQAEDALTQIAALERDLPNNPEVARMRFAALLMGGKREQARGVYSAMPEASRQDLLAKTGAAVQLGETADAIRLLEAARKLDPKAADVAMNLAQLYASAKRPDDAQRVLAEAMAANPDNAALKVLDARLRKATPEELRDMLEQATDDIADPYARELNKAAIAADQGRADDAIAHLAAADKIKPGDPRVADLLFQQHLAKRKFDEAGALIPTLANANHDKANGLLYKFRLAMARGQTPEALNLAQDITRRLPEFGQSWLAYGQALQAAGKYDEAADKYAQALQRQTNNLDALKGLIDTYYATGRSREAGEVLAQARRNFPNDAAVREAELQHQQAYGDPTAVLPAREAAAEQQPDRPQPQAALAAAYARVAQDKASRGGADAAKPFLLKARDTLAAAVAKFPDERTLYAQSADVALALNDVAGAEAALKAYAARDAAKASPDADLMLADLYARTNRPADAEAALRAALAKGKSAPPLRVRLAMLLAQNDRADEALALVPSDDKEAAVRRARIDVLVATGKADEAAALLAKESAADPTAVDLQLAQANLLLGRGKADEAVAKVTDVLAASPRNVQALALRAAARQRLATPDLKGAIEDLVAARDANPRNVDVRVQLAEAYARRNEPDRATVELEQALQQAPTNKLLRLRLLNAYASANPPRTGDADRLIAEVAGYAAFQKDVDWVAAEAQFYSARGNHAKAKARIRDAVALAPASLPLTQVQLNILLAAKDHKTVLAEADKLIADMRANPQPWPLQYRAAAKKGLGDAPGATADFRQAFELAKSRNDALAMSNVARQMARELSPEAALALVEPLAASDLQWRLLTAELQSQKGDQSAGVKSIEAVIADAAFAKAPPEFQVAALRFAGTLYLTLRPQPDVAKAHEAYLKLLERVPDDMTALNNMAVLLAENMTPPQPERALLYSTRAYDNLRRVGRTDPLVADTQGWTLVLAGRVDEGIDILRGIVNSPNPILDARYHLGAAHLRQSPPYPEEAKRQLQRAAADYEDAVKQGKSLDPALKSRIAEALAKAEEMVKAAGGPAAGANAGQE